MLKIELVEIAERISREIRQASTYDELTECVKKVRLHLLSFTGADMLDTVKRLETEIINRRYELANAK